MFVSEVDVTGLNKKQLLKELWKNSKPAAFFSMNRFPAPTDCSDNEIEKVLSSEECYADYLCGRLIKTSFKTDKLNPRGYDRDNGAGAMQKVVDSMRYGSSAPTFTTTSDRTYVPKYSAEIEAKISETSPMLSYDTVNILISMNKTASDVACTDELIKKRANIANSS